MNSQGKGRLYWLDVARVVAIVSVVFNHALSRSFSVYQNTLTEFNQMSLTGSYIKAMLYVFSRLGVPLFLMVSGTLLLKRDYEDKANLNRFIRHNWFSLFRTTEIWLVIMFLFLQVFPNSALRTGGITKSAIKLIETMLFINQDTMVSMWYMAMILVVYLMIPVLSVAVRRIGDKYIAMLCLTAVVIGMIVPNIGTALNAVNPASEFEFALNIGDLFSVYIIYILVGYWISNGVLMRINSLLICIGFVACLVLTSAFQCWIYSSPVDYSIRYADIGVLLTGAFLFELIRRTKTRDTNTKHSDAVTYISKISFAIYFVHICVMTGLNVITDNLIHITGFAEFAMLAVDSFGISAAAIWLLSKNKIMSKYLFQIKDNV